MRKEKFVLSLPFVTFGDVAAAGFEISVYCRCCRSALLDATSDTLRDRLLCGARLRCSTVFWDGTPCTGSAHLYINHIGSWAMQMARRPKMIFRP